MYEISSSGLFIKETVSGVTCLVNETSRNKGQLSMSSHIYFSIMFYDYTNLASFCISWGNEMYCGFWAC